MSRTVNKVILVGHVGRDPEVLEDANGDPEAVLSLRTDGHHDDGERDDQWHCLTMPGKLANFADEYIREGARIYVEGRLYYGSYERDGVTIPTADIIVREVVLLRKNGEASAERVHTAAGGG